MGINVINKYLSEHSSDYNEVMLSYVSMLEVISQQNPYEADAIVREIKNQRSRIKLIASENYSSPSCHIGMGNLLTDKYAEGYPYHRYYAGCENVDAMEQLAVDKAKELFGADHAYVQPHSGADANLVAYWAILDAKVLGPAFEQLKTAYDCSIVKKNIKTYNDLNDEEWWYLRHLAHNQKLLSMDYNSGSHLTHGYRQNVSAQLFDCHHYSVNEEGLLNYDAIEKQAIDIKPLIILAGYSAYPRKINFRRFREIADKVNAVLMVDMAHFAGLVAGKVFTDDYDPVKWADIVTTTTHKTLRGPRGGMILCKDWLKDSVNKGCPLVLGGPLPHVMAAKSTALIEALKPEFKEYAKQIVENSKALSEALIAKGAILQTGGTDNHMMVMRTESFDLNGRQAENALFECGIILNRNAIPNDPNGPWYTSGLRLGTAAVTTLGMNSKDMREIADIIIEVLNNAKPKIVNDKVSKSEVEIPETSNKDALDRVNKLLSKYVLYPQLDLEFLMNNFCIKK